MAHPKDESDRMLIPGILIALLVVALAQLALAMKAQR
jgi:hypothetical protein